MQQRQHDDLRSMSLEYTHQELTQATLGWHASKKLGSGSYGAVFKGELPDGSEVAIKMIDLGALRAAGQGPETAGFDDEIKTLSKFRHPNLVTLLGWASHQAHRYLVYELLPGGDAFQRLQKSIAPGSTHLFLWHERLSVYLDAALGLSHMHNHKPKAFHRDIKSANILLDKHGTAKMADFGLSCTCDKPGGDNLHKTVKAISGTPGYACPIYAKTGKVTEGSEVYSFGMVMLELLTSLAPATADPRMPLGIAFPIESHLHPNQAGAQERVLSSLDRTASWPSGVAKELAALSLRCVIASDDKKRPLFVEIVRTLRKMTEDYPKPSPQAQVVIVQQPAPAVSPGAPPATPQHPGAAPPGKSPQPQGVAQGRNAREVPVEYMPAARGSPVCLELVKAQGLDVDSLPPDFRRLPLAPPAGAAPQPSGAFVAPVGREHQPELFNAWLPDVNLQNCVSRTAFEINWTGGGAQLVARGSNPVSVDGRTTERGVPVTLRPGSEIGFVGREVCGEAMVFLLVRAVFKQAGAAADSPPPSRSEQQAAAGAVADSRTPLCVRAEGKWRLVCVRAEGFADGEIEVIAEERRCIDLTEGVTVVGRQHQSGVFESLLSRSPSRMGLVSRAHLQIQVQGASLNATNLSGNPVYIDFSALQKGESRVLARDAKLSFALPEGSSITHFLVLKAVFVAGATGARPTPAAQGGAVQATATGEGFGSPPSRRTGSASGGFGASSSPMSPAANPAPPRATGAQEAPPAARPVEIVLELCGRGVVNTPAGERRLGPQCLASGGPVVVGRKHQRALHERAVQKEWQEFVSREHFQVSQGDSALDFRLKVLTSNPVWHRARVGGAPAQLAKGDEVALALGDCIIIDTDHKDPFSEDLESKVLYWHFRQATAADA